ncbi:MAG: M20 family metallopeptidase [Opitutaceae bacterium]
MTDTREERIRRRLVALTRDLMLIPSIPSRPEDRRRCLELVRNQIEGLPSVEITEYEHRGHPSLVARPRGCERPEVLLCGHLDVITHSDIGLYRSELRDGRIVGPGAGDMKGALAILLELFRELHTRQPGISLGLAVTSDEETGGESGIGHLVGACGLRCAAAMIPDGGSIGDITVEEKGILHVRMRCHGRPAHAARPWRGDNPVEHLLDGLARLRERFAAWRATEGGADGETDAAFWHPTCAVTIIGTENTTVNRIPADAAATLDIRFPPPHTVASMSALLREALGPSILREPIISAEATQLSPDPLYIQVTEEILGRPAGLAHDAGGSDARFFTPRGIPVLMSRPLAGRLHSDDEWIDIDSMVQFHRICELYLERRLGVAPRARDSR